MLSISGRHFRSLARVSRTPGRTQQINFFLIDERIVLADLPGYGFARVPRPVQQQWKTLVEGYLASRDMLRAVMVLIDIRRGVQADDTVLLTYLHQQHIPAQVVVTKADKLAYGARRRQAREIAAQLPNHFAAPLICSAQSGDGVREVWQAVQEYLRSTTPDESPVPE